MIRLLAAAAITAVTALSCSTPAPADATDDAFFDVIDAAGITYKTPERAILVAYAVCVDLEDGRNAEQIAVELADTVGLPVESASLFVAAAIAAYCPQHNLVARGWVV